jgi:hypothetical protein
MHNYLLIFRCGEMRKEVVGGYLMIKSENQNQENEISIIYPIFEHNGNL